MEAAVKKSMVWGVASAGLLLSFYWLVLSLANSFDHAVQQWWQLWFWISLLVVGFGIQVGLYVYVRSVAREKEIRGISGEVAATGGVTAGSMVACCVHHAADALPIIGLSAAALWLSEYQQFFMVAGVAGNLIGIVYMIEVIKKHRLYKEGSMLGWLVQYDVTQLKRGLVIGAVAGLVIVFMGSGQDDSQREVAAQEQAATDRTISGTVPDITAVSMPSRTDTGGGLTVKVTPVNFIPGEPVQFEVSLDTHQGDLNFDLAAQSYLVDDQGSRYQPIEWRGGSGGHHLTGELVFPAAAAEAKAVQLVVQGVYGVPERLFAWSLEK